LDIGILTCLLDLILGLLFRVVRLFLVADASFVVLARVRLVAVGLGRFLGFRNCNRSIV